MEIARASLILGIVLSRPRSQCDFEIFLHLLKYKLDIMMFCISAMDNARKLKFSSYDHLPSIIWLSLGDFMTYIPRTNIQR